VEAWGKGSPASKKVSISKKKQKGKVLEERYTHEKKNPLLKSAGVKPPSKASGFQVGEMKPTRN